MAELKTKATEQSVKEFLNNITDQMKKDDCYALLEMMKKVTKEDAKMWGSSMVGFGKYHYKYDSGREGDWFVTGFSPRKNNLTLYLMSGFIGYDELLNNLGKYKKGQSCLYVKSLKDINISILTEMIKKSIEETRLRYPDTD